MVAGGWEERYRMLDAWRGIAAMMVVLHHVAGVHIGHDAVMLFFVISGYCIAASAEACLTRALAFRTFMWRRVKRIFPPYLLALAFFAVTRLIKIAMGGNNDLARTPVEWLQNLTLTQWVSLISHPMPLAEENRTNFVAAFWSLNYEEQFYLVVAVVILPAIARFRLATLQTLIVLSLVWNVFFRHASYGFFLESFFHFGMGTLLFYRLCRFGNRAAIVSVDGALFAATLGFGYMGWIASGLAPIRTIVFRDLFTAAGFAFLLVLLRPLDAAFQRVFVGRALMRFGMITYSLYLVHQFNITLVQRAAAVVVPPSWPVAFVMAQVAIHVAIASAFWYCCERPFINQGLPRESRNPVHAAVPSPAVADPPHP